MSIPLITEGLHSDLKENCGNTGACITLPPASSRVQSRNPVRGLSCAAVEKRARQFFCFLMERRASIQKFLERTIWFCGAQVPINPGGKEEEEHWRSFQTKRKRKERGRKWDRQIRQIERRDTVRPRERESGRKGTLLKFKSWRWKRNLSLN